MAKFEYNSFRPNVQAATNGRRVTNHYVKFGRFIFFNFSYVSIACARVLYALDLLTRFYFRFFFFINNIPLKIVIVIIIIVCTTVRVIFYKMYITMRRPPNTKQNFSFIPPVPVTNGPKTIICSRRKK